MEGRGVVGGEFKSIYWFQIFTLGSNNVKKKIKMIVWLPERFPNSISKTSVISFTTKIVMISIRNVNKQSTVWYFTLRYSFNA